MTVNPGSFRDPPGTVFTKQGQVYRSIFRPGGDDFSAAKDAGIYNRLVEKGFDNLFHFIDHTTLSNGRMLF